MQPISLIAWKPAIVAVVLMALMGPYPSTPSLAADVSVVSGSVIDVGGMRIRLWGIRLPEASATCHRGGGSRACASLSRRVLERFIGNEELRCLVMVNQPGQPISAKCSVQEEDLGHLMVLSGWATDDGAESGGFYALQEEVAREQRVGMWKDR